MKKIKTYFKVWRLNASNTIQELLVNRATHLLFFMGKMIKLSMSLLFLFLIKEQVAQFANYTTDQVIVFFLTYQFIDVLAQVFFRGVYLFRDRIIRGNFDFMLLRPINPLFQALTDHPDINDTIFLIPTTILSIYIASTLNIHITINSLTLYFLLLINAFLIAAALHILVLVAGILTKDTEGFIWMYRDMIQFARFPVTVYLEPLRSILFFIIPVGMMITIPSEVLLNLKPTYSIGVAFAIGLGSIILSLRLWKWSLKKYSSASS
ncbi:ABC transporter permease [Patescibacteria group bacterium]|nr:ABC transporter permease [Patescibacteria group bacterium]MBU1966728.1 ABC transporter permease [Patescibacteria group bacterium]MBU2543744.1 ABC transporter permease [Patescibacteria group bacterium]